MVIKIKTVQIMLLNAILPIKGNWHKVVPFNVTVKYKLANEGKQVKPLHTERLLYSKSYENVKNTSAGVNSSQLCILLGKKAN